MNVIIGNGINYEQFPKQKWNNFAEYFDQRFVENYAKIKNTSGIIHKFLSKIITKVLQEKELEKKLIYSDFNQVVRMISLEDWLWLINEDRYFPQEDLIYYWQLSNGETQSNFDITNNENFLIMLSTLSMVFFSSINILFNTSIHDVLKQDYNALELSYSQEFIKWLKSCDNIFSFNVDGIINKSDLEVKFPHGFLNFEDPKDYYETLTKNVNYQDPDLFFEMSEIVKTINVNPYEILFNYSSEAKTQDIDFFKDMLDNNSNSNAKTSLHEKARETVQENREYNNVDVYAYNDLKNSCSDFVVIGLSYNGDEKCFEILKNNNNINKVYFYGDKEEYELIDSDKFIYCGFWNEKQYCIQKA